MSEQSTTTRAQELRQQAYNIRKLVLEMARSRHGVHIGGSLSAVDLLTVLYFHVMRVRPHEPDWPGRDYFILSKGHSCAGLYGTLAARGFIAIEELATYGEEEGRLGGHPLRRLPGIEFATGSLGHGLPLGVGTALAARRDQLERRAFVVVGDGELQEGTVWEAAMAAGHFELDNLVAVVDRNGLQISGATERLMQLEPLAERWRSFGWAAVEVDGHDVDDLIEVFDRLPIEPGKPSVVIAKTVKGKGVQFLENNKKCHYLTLTPKLYNRAIAQLQIVEERS